MLWFGGKWGGRGGVSRANVFARFFKGARDITTPFSLCPFDQREREKLDFFPCLFDNLLDKWHRNSRFDHDQQNNIKWEKKENSNIEEKKMDLINYQDIASGFGLSDDAAKDLYDTWMANEDPNLGDAEPEERFKEFLDENVNGSSSKAGLESAQTMGAGAGGGGGDDKYAVEAFEQAVDAVGAEPKCRMAVFGQEPSKRTPVEFVRADSPEIRAAETPEIRTAEFGGAQDQDEYGFSEDFEDAGDEVPDSVYGIGTSRYEGVEAAFGDPSAAVFDDDDDDDDDGADPWESGARFEPAGAQEALDSWDDLLEELEKVSTGPSEPSKSKKDQTALKDLLMREGNHVSNDLTTKRVVLVIIPNENMASSTLSRIQGNASEKTKFVMAHLLLQSGSQPDSQLWDRPYRALDDTEYSWPSTGEYRIVRRGNNAIFLGQVENATRSKHGKQLKPIYIAPDCDKVLG